MLAALLLVRRCRTPQALRPAIAWTLVTAVSHPLLLAAAYGAVAAMR